MTYECACGARYPDRGEYIEHLAECDVVQAF